MKKNYIQPAADYYVVSAAEDYLTTSIPMTDENVDDSGKAKGNIFDEEEDIIPTSVWD